MNSEKRIIDEESNVSIKEKAEINIQTDLTDYEKEIERSYLRKIDYRILPVVIMVYIASLIDRGVVNYALVNGLRDGLNLSNIQEGNATTFFYVFYILFETPSNVILKKLRPRIWFPLIGLGFSISTLLSAFAKTGTEYVIYRSLLGAFEAGFTPGVVGYLGYWYVRGDIGKRMVIFFTAVPLSGIFGKPFSAGLASMKILLKYPYQNIYLFHGILTILITGGSYFFLIDYPDKSNFLKPEEKELLLKRLQAEQGMASKIKPDFKDTIRFLLDWKLWAFSFLFFGLNNSIVILNLFAPTVISTMGFSGVTSTYLATITSATGLFGTLSSVYFLNKVPYYKLIIIYATITAIGFSVALFSNGTGLRLAFIAISGFGASPVVPMSISWMSINQGGVYKALISSAVQLSVGSICGVVSPRFFTKKYLPRFRNGVILYLCALGASICIAISLSIYFRRENKRRDENPEDVSHLSLEDQRKLCDKHPNFRYRL
ncbi:putative tartrate transporter [Smittium culicis]|uniref:Putative tartrate transporter n=1 Tax=Smittium culicis TaxID=133412 RepID=A0A1R1XM37_9FUNG|nr:putative tartrate transporter [Smittium culicis]